jgi:hypothetical protein
LADAINLGSAVDTTASTLELSSPELATISTTGLVSIGNAGNSGVITVSAPITLPYNTTLINGAGGILINGAIAAGAGAVNLTSTGTISEGTGGSITAGTLTTSAVGGTTLSGANVMSNFGATDTGVVSITNTAATLGLNATTTLSLLVNNTGSISVNGFINATGAGDAIVLNAVTGNFINKVGAAALNAPNGRWLVYSIDPTLNAFGGLASGNFALWGSTFTSNAPASVAAGNHYLFSLVPTLTVGGDVLPKIYGVDLTLTPPAPTITGLINASAYGNVFTQDLVTGTASVTCTGFASTAAISATPYPMIVKAGTFIAPVGYGTTNYVNSSLLVLAPTVLSEIANISVMFSPDTGSAQSTSSQDKAEVVVMADIKQDNGAVTQQLPMCR